MISRRNLAFGAVGSALALAVLSAAPAHAAFVFNIQPDGQGNIVANGSGTINLTSLQQVPGPAFTNAAMGPGGADILVGSTPFAAGSFNAYQGGIIPQSLSFGPGLTTTANTGSGSIVGVVWTYRAIVVPSTYVSGAYLSDSATWDNSTLSSLGLTPGSYLFHWPSDSLTVNILSSPIPEPTSLSLLGIGSVALLGRRRRVV
jgi:hypothetical protein